MTVAWMNTAVGRAGSSYVVLRRSLLRLRNAGYFSRVKRLPIERRSGLSAEAFARDFLAGEGKPVILTDAIEGWPARQKWTFDYFKAQYGSDLVHATPKMQSGFSCATKLATYFDHLDSPRDLPGLWVESKSGRPAKLPDHLADLPPYLMAWGAFERHPELHDDVFPPAFTSDWSTTLDAETLTKLEEIGCPELWSLYVGPAGTISPLHRDFASTHSWLAQLQGSKRAWLFAPEDGPLLYEGEADPERPDFARHPDLAKATVWEGDFGPGEVLFTPSDWWHQVRSLTNSITVSHNFFNEWNLSRYLAEVVRLASSP